MTAPVNSVLPAITGTATVGSTLAVSDGTWNNAPTSYAYAWLRSDVVIAGAVANTYTITLGELLATITGRVTAANTDGSTPATSAATAAVPSTLIPETGALVAGADSYGSLTDADTYHAARGNSAWAAMSAENKEAAARRAADYMLQVYRARWKGYRKSTTQTLDWPREMVFLDPSVNGIGVDAAQFGYGFGYTSVIPNNVVPVEVKNAWAELALRAASAALAPDLSRLTTSEKVGQIAVTYDNYLGPAFVQFRAVDLLLQPFMNVPSFAAKLVRV